MPGDDGGGGGGGVERAWERGSSVTETAWSPAGVPTGAYTVTQIEVVTPATANAEVVRSVGSGHHPGPPWVFDTMAERKQQRNNNHARRGSQFCHPFDIAAAEGRRAAGWRVFLTWA